MGLTSAPLQKSPWRGLLLAALYLTYWNSPTIAKLIAKAIPTYVAEGGNVLLVVDNMPNGFEEFFWMNSSNKIRPQHIVKFETSKGKFEIRDGYSGREKFYPNGSLLFQNVTRYNGGPYKIGVFYPFYASYDNVSVKFHVHYGPDVPIISHSNHHFFSKTNLNLSCQTDSSPPALYFWYFNGELLSSSQELFISNINTSNSGSYTCLVYNSFTGFNRTTVENIEVFDRVTVAYLHVSNVRIPVNDPVFLTCFSNDTGIAIQWFFNGKSLELTNRMVLSMDSSTLCIDPVKMKDSGFYECEVFNEFSSKMSNKIMLDIDSNDTHEETEHHLSFLVEAVPPHVVEGGNVLLDVKSARSLYIEIVWYYERNNEKKRGEIVRFEDFRIIEKGDKYTGREILYPNGSLFFQNVTRHYGGQYTFCGIIPAVYDFDCINVKFHVHYGPDVPIISRSNLHFYSKTNLNLSCQTDSSPPALYFWYFNGELLSSSQELFISNINTSNSGSYTCLVYNSFTGFNRTTVENIEVFEPVTLPFIQATNTTVKELDSVFLTCFSNDTGISIQWFFNGQSLDLTYRMKLSQNRSTLNIDPVVMGDSGEYQCEVSNPVSYKRSKPIRLDIIASPTTTNFTVEAVPPYVAEGQNVLLHVHNLPVTARVFYWYKGKTVANRNEIARVLGFKGTNKTGPIYSGREKIYHNGSLLFQNVTQKDAGAYILRMIGGNLEVRDVSVQLHVNLE